MKSILFKYMSKFTSLTEEQQQTIANEIKIDELKKGTILFRQGDVPTKCYFVLSGCIRQYSVDENGKEVTSNFYTEEQAIAVFNNHKLDKSRLHFPMFRGFNPRRWGFSYRTKNVYQIYTVGSNDTKDD